MSVKVVIDGKVTGKTRTKSKSKKRGRPIHSQNRLSQAVIINCAKQLMDADGKVPSIRKIATTLEVDAMAIYYYFANKNALLEALAVSLIDEIYLPSGENTWQIELERLCISYLKLLEKHAGLLETLLSMSCEGPAKVFIQRYHIALAPLNLEEQILKDGLDLLADYLHGFALAIHCNQTSTPISTSQIAGPLRLYIKAISSK